MPQSNRPLIHKKLDLSAAWSCGPRTLQWENLWRRILSVNGIESCLKEEGPSTDRGVDGI